MGSELYQIIDNRIKQGNALKKSGSMLLNENMQQIEDINCFLDLFYDVRNKYQKICIFFKSQTGKDNKMIACNRFFDVAKINPKKESTVSLGELVFYLADMLEDVNIYCSIASFRGPSKREYDQRQEYLMEEFMSGGKLTKEEQEEFGKPFRYVCHRQQQYAIQACVLFCDVDCYHESTDEKYRYLSPQELWNVIQEENPKLCELLDLFVIESGYGLQIYIKMEAISLMSGLNGEHSYRALNVAFNQLFEKYGADTACTRDIVRVLRMPHTYNWKHNAKKEVRILKKLNNANHQYSAWEFWAIMNQLGIKYVAEEYRAHPILTKGKAPSAGANMKEVHHERQKTLTVRKEKTHAGTSRERSAAKKIADGEDKIICEQAEKNSPIEKVKKESCVYWGKIGQSNLIKMRCSDIHMYCSHRGWNLVGRRNVVLFVYALLIYKAFKGDEDAILNELKTLNNKFMDSLDEEEVVNIVHSVAAYNGTITNEKIKNMLGYTEEDIANMQGSYTEEAKREKRRLKQARHRARKGALDRHVELQRSYEIIKENMHMTDKQLAELIGKSVSTVRRRKKEIEKEFLK